LLKLAFNLVFFLMTIAFNLIDKYKTIFLINIKNELNN